MILKRGLICIILSCMLIIESSAVCRANQASPSHNYAHQIKQAVSFLHQVQNKDGGFPSVPGGSSSRAVTCWVIMGLAAVGEQVSGSSWAPAGKTPLDYLESNPQALNETTEYARLMLALCAAGQQPQYQGINLRESIAAFQQSSGQFAQLDKGEAGFINAHMWSVIALASAGSIPNQEMARSWLLSRQNSDGGFGWLEGIASDVDDTGIGIMALVLLGEKTDSPAIEKAVKYLQSCQTQDGGFSCGDEWMGSESNAASDAWGILGLIAAGEDLQADKWRVNGKNPMDHLLSLQGKDGAFKWKPGVDSAAITMTAYGLIAMAGKPFPVNIDYRTRAESVATSAPGLNQFTDLKAGDWGCESVMKLVEKGVLSGYPDGSFKPANSISRAEFARIIVSALSLQDGQNMTARSFIDVPADYWAHRNISICASQGLIEGLGDGRFDPDGNITGAQLATILVRALPGAEATAEPEGFLWYSKYISQARDNNLLYPGFQAESPVSRVQCAYSIMQLCQHLQR